jgi:hypothetical protein
MSKLSEAKELVRQELLESLQNKNGQSARDLFEVYDKLRELSPGDVIEFTNPESAYNFQLSSDYLDTVSAEQYPFGVAAAGPVDYINGPGGLGTDVISFGGDTAITTTGGDGTDTISLG